VLVRNHPNPFSPATRIGYSLPARAAVTVKVYDVQGQEVATLVDRVQGPGYTEVEWKAPNAASGVYFCRMIARTEGSSRAFVSSRRMLLLK
jgi:hypothetical protein